MRCKMLSVPLPAPRQPAPLHWLVLGAGFGYPDPIIEGRLYIVFPRLTTKHFPCCNHQALASSKACLSVVDPEPCPVLFLGTEERSCVPASSLPFGPVVPSLNSRGNKVEGNAGGVTTSVHQVHSWRTIDVCLFPCALWVLCLHTLAHFHPSHMAWTPNSVGAEQHTRMQEGADASSWKQCTESTNSWKQWTES